MRVYHLLIGIIILALSPFIFKSVFKKAPTDNQLKLQQPVPSPTISASPKSESIPKVTNPQALKVSATNTWIADDAAKTSRFLNHSEVRYSVGVVTRSRLI